MVNVPVRVAPVSASKLNVASPLLVPLEVVCSHDSFACAFQLPAPLTMSDDVPPEGPSTSEAVPRTNDSTSRDSRTSIAGRPPRFLRAGRRIPVCVRPQQGTITRNHDCQE